MVQKVEKVERVVKFEKVEKIEMVEKMEKIDKMQKVKKVEKVEILEKVEMVEKMENIEKFSHTQISVEGKLVFFFKSALLHLYCMDKNISNFQLLKFSNGSSGFSTSSIS